MSTFFINTQADASQSLVFSLTDNTVRELPTLFVGDSLPINFIFTDGSGGYADFNAENNLSVKVAIGDLATGTLYVLQDNFTFTNNTYSTVLVLMTDALASAITGTESIQPFFEIQIIKTNGESYTVFQNNVTIKNQLISNVAVNLAVQVDNSIGVPISTLDTYEIDTDTDLETGDIIQILADLTRVSDGNVTTTLNTGEYYRIDGYNNGVITINLYGEDYHMGITNNPRGTAFVKVNAPASATENTNNTVDNSTDDTTSDDTSSDDNTTTTYVTDSTATLAIDQTIQIQTNFTMNGRDFVQGEIFTVTAISSSDMVKVVIDGVNYWIGQRGTRFEVAVPDTGSDDNTSDDTTTVAEGTQYYIWGDDNTNGVGYYYPVYSENTGLTSYHSHTFAGNTYYMKDSDMNHAESGLPANNTLPPATDNLEPPNYLQLVWGSNYESKSSAFVVNANRRGYTWVNGGSTSNTNSRSIDISNGKWRYIFNNSQEDIFSTSIHDGQGVLGDMSDAHTFQIYKYTITSVETVSVNFSGTVANRKIGVEAQGTFADSTERQTAETTSLDIFSEYSSQPTDSIWRDAGSGDYGLIMFNQTKNVFYQYISNETGYIYGNTLTETTAFEVGDEIIVLFE